MLWFKKSKTSPASEHMKEVAQHSAIEIIAHKNAKAEVVEDAKKANEQLKTLLDANGFTLKIYLAAGGHQLKTHKGNT
jgi:hypothetical protein